MRHTFVLAVFFAALAVSGCGTTQQPNQSQSQTQTRMGFADQAHAQLVIAPKVDDLPAHPLPFKGKLISGDKAELPPAVAMSLSDNSPVTFTYREELTHDDYHVPLVICALDPANLIGAPLGDIGVDGVCVLVDQRRRHHCRRLHRQGARLEVVQHLPRRDHEEVDEAARAAVRQRIDQKIYNDEARLAKAVASARNQNAPTASARQ